MWMLIKTGACSLAFWEARSRHRAAESCKQHAGSYRSHYCKFPQKQDILKQGLTRFPLRFPVLPPFSSRLSFIQHPGSSSFYAKYWEIHSFIDYPGNPCDGYLCSPTQLGIMVSTVSWKMSWENRMDGPSSAMGSWERTWEEEGDIDQLNEVWMSLVFFFCVV